MNAQYLQDVKDWYTIAMQLKQIKADESKLRSKVTMQCFPTLIAGTNNLELDDGFVLSAVTKMERKVDEPSLPGVLDELRQAGATNADSLISYKPSLVMAEYKKLTDAQRAIFDKCLTAKLSSPQLSVTQKTIKKD